MFSLAQRNGVALPYASVEEVRAAYDFDDLPSFLSLYYQGMAVLRTAEDFFDLAMDYFRRAHGEGVVHVELSFDPQAHLSRGIGLDVQMEGLTRAMRLAERELDISSALIMSFLRDRPAEEAMEVLEQAAPYWELIDAVGLDSAELGHPPSKFAAVFERAKGWACQVSPMRARRARPAIFVRPWRCSTSAVLITACAASRTRRWWRSLSSVAYR